MRRPLHLLALFAVPVTPAFAQPVPQTRTVAVVDTLFGVAVPDPYHWLEALDAPEVQAWFGAQAAYARSRLDALPGHGRANALEFGSIETEAGFRALLAMSPYHHVRPGAAYPAVMLWTGLEDTRVPPWESAKMAAALQAASSSDNPVLLRVQQAGGHISGALPATEARLRVADTLAFFMTAVGLPPYRSPAR